MSDILKAMNAGFAALFGEPRTMSEMKWEPLVGQTEMDRLIDNPPFELTTCASCLEATSDIFALLVRMQGCVMDDCHCTCHEGEPHFV